ARVFPRDRSRRSYRTGCLRKARKDADHWHGRAITKRDIDCSALAEQRVLSDSGDVQNGREWDIGVGEGLLCLGERVASEPLIEDPVDLVGVGPSALAAVVFIFREVIATYYSCQASPLSVVIRIDGDEHGIAG